MNDAKRLESILRLAGYKNDYIDAQLAKLDKLLKSSSSKLTRSIISKVLQQLEIKDGKIVTNSQNILKALTAGKVFDDFMKTVGSTIVNSISTSLGKIGDYNHDYYNKLAGEQLSRTQIDKAVNARLGLTEKGDIKSTGFMKSLATSPDVKRRIVEYMSAKVGSNAGYNDINKGLKTLIQGTDADQGIFQKYYRNTVYDTFAKVDAMHGNMYADKLQLNYFIYAGTRRKHSRHFCIERKGKVFSREEAQEWKKLIGTTTEDEDGKRIPAGPIVSKEDKDTYDPLQDRGGYGCVDDLNWISDELAFRKRPDLLNAWEAKLMAAETQKSQVIRLAAEGKTPAEIVALTGIPLANVKWYFSKLKLGGKHAQPPKPEAQPVKPETSPLPPVKPEPKPIPTMPPIKPEEQPIATEVKPLTLEEKIHVAHIESRNRKTLNELEKAGVKYYPEMARHWAKNIKIEFSKEAKGSFYDPNTDTLVIQNGSRVKTSKTFREKIMLHEGGHAIHLNKEIISKTGAVKWEFKKLRNELKEIIGDKASSLHNKLSRESYKHDSEHFSIMNDILGSLTLGKYGGGHSVEYYNRKGGAYADMELFAHAVTLAKMGSPYSNVDPTLKSVIDKLSEYGSQWLK